VARRVQGIAQRGQPRHLLGERGSAFCRAVAYTQQLAWQYPRTMPARAAWLSHMPVTASTPSHGEAYAFRLRDPGGAAGPAGSIAASSLTSVMVDVHSNSTTEVVGAVHGSGRSSLIGTPLSELAERWRPFARSAVWTRTFRRPIHLAARSRAGTRLASTVSTQLVARWGDSGWPFSTLASSGTGLPFTCTSSCDHLDKAMRPIRPRVSCPLRT